jgi:glycosyltransferase involved in cell wall biosynthesis
MPQPFISICIPAYKRPELLRKLFNSIAEQEYRDFEIIINDNSDDDSVKEAVIEFSSRLQIDYEKNPPGINAPENCMRTIRRSKGSWIKIMHDDDWFANISSLKLFAEAAQAGISDFIFSGCNYIDLVTGETELYILSPMRKAMLDAGPVNLLYQNIIGHPSVVMFKRDDAIEIDPSYNWVVDLDFYIRYTMRHQGSYNYIESPAVNIGRSSSQETRKYEKKAHIEIPEYLRLLAGYDQTLPVTNEYVFHLLWTLARRYRLKSIDDIRQLPYKGAIPGIMTYIINYQKRFPRIVLKQPKWSLALMKKSFANLAKMSGDEVRHQ